MESNLLQLVDSALSSPDVNVVNFKCLRTLLIELVNKIETPNIHSKDDIVGGEKKLVDNKSFDEGITIDQPSRNSQQNFLSPVEREHEKENLRQEIARLEAGQNLMNERLISIEENLSKYEAYPDVKNYLEVKSKTPDITIKEPEIETDESDEKNNIPQTSSELLVVNERPLSRCANQEDQFGVTWQIRKIASKLNTAEEAIDKLFELNKEVLNKYSNHQTDENLDKDVENLKKDFDDFKSSIKKNSSESDIKNNEEYLLKINELEKQLDLLKKQMESLASDTNKNNESGDKENIKDFSNKINELDEFMKNNMKDDVTKDNLAKDIENIQKKIENLESNLNSRNDNVLIEDSGVTYKNDLNNVLKNIEDLQNEQNIMSNQVKELQQSLHKLNEDNSLVENQNISERPNSELKIPENIPHFTDAEDLNKLIKQMEKIELEVRNKVDIERFDHLQNDFNVFQKKNDDNFNNIFEQLTNIKNQLKDFSLEEMKKLLDHKDDFQNMSKTIDDLESLSKLKHLADNVDDLKSIKQKLEDLHENFNTLKNYDHLENEITDINNKLSNVIIETSTATKPSIPDFDTSVIAAIQNVAQNNRQDISAIKADMNIMKKVTTMPPPPTSTNNHDANNQKQISNNDLVENLQSRLLALEEEQVRVSGNISNISDDMKDEFFRKQQHIDALYDYIEKLQLSKADKNDLSSEMNVKADKKALDNKVNMSTFDERYTMLEQALQDALSRLDHYVQKEASTNDALNKLNDELQTKMDSDAEKKLKKFLNERLKELQKQRVEISEQQPSVDFDPRNAAGLRKPMPLSYHCISCDRPIDVTLRGSMPPIPQNFPSKKSLGPYKSYELDQLRQSKRVNVYDKFYVNRQCGGQHTVTNMRQQKSIPHTVNQSFQDAYDEKTQTAPVSIIDCVVGKDGQIYRGRFRSDEMAPRLPPTKKTSPVHSRTKHNYRASYSANLTKQNNVRTSSDDTLRAHSANDAEPVTSVTNQESVSLPPINHDASLVKDSIHAAFNDDTRSSSVNSVGVN